MITSFRHKGLKQMFEKGQARLIDPSLRVRVANILAVLDAASSALDLASPGNRLHELQGDQWFLVTDDRSPGSRHRGQPRQSPNLAN